MLRQANREIWLRWGLYLIGLTALLAIVPILLPTAWLARIADELGLVMDASPLTRYFSRQLSLWYAFFGCILLYLAQDIPRYRPLLRLIGFLVCGFGATQLAIDYFAEMPTWWTAIEGPRVLIAGMILIWLAREPA